MTPIWRNKRERVTEGRQRLVPPRQVSGLERRAPGGEQSLPVVRGAGRMVDDLDVVHALSEDRVDVSRGDRGVDAGGVRGRGVRSHAALAAARRRCGRESRRRRLGRELVEAGERLGVAIGVEDAPCASARPSAPKTRSRRQGLS